VRTDGVLSRAAWFFSLVLGQASTLVGLMLALGWAFAFALIATSKSASWGTGPQATLPIEPPLFGLALGVLGLLVARMGRQPVARYAVAGLVLNALPLVLTLVLLALRAGH
jgi:hypothetical protein